MPELFKISFYIARLSGKRTDMASYSTGPLQTPYHSWNKQKGAAGLHSQSKMLDRYVGMYMDLESHAAACIGT